MPDSTDVSCDLLSLHNQCFSLVCFGIVLLKISQGLEMAQIEGEMMRQADSMTGLKLAGQEIRTKN